MTDKQKLENALEVVRHRHESLKFKNMHLEETRQAIRNLRYNVRRCSNSDAKRQLKEQLSDLKEYEQSLIYEIGMINRTTKVIAEMISKIESDTTRTIMQKYYLGDSLVTLVNVAKELSYSYEYVKNRKRKGFLALLKIGQSGYLLSLYNKKQIR